MRPESQAELREFEAYLADKAARRSLGVSVFENFAAWKRYRDFNPVGPTPGQASE